MPTFDHPRQTLNSLAAISLILSLPGLVASFLLLVPALLGRVSLGPREALALLIEMALLALASALCWLAMTQALRDDHRRRSTLRAVLDHINDGVLNLDEHGHFLSANPALLRMIPEERLRQIDADPLEETLHWKQTVFSVVAAPAPGAGSVLVFRDETRRFETERAKEALLATASHELRTPLGVVMNYLELLMMLNQTGKNDTGQFSEYLLRALENSRRLLRLVNDILDQAQLEAGVLQLRDQFFNPRQLLENVVAIMEMALQEKGLSAELTVAPNVPEEINGDPARLRKVLLNLLDNAIKFTPQGGVKLRVSAPGGDVLYIEVADSGLGIPLAQLPDVFEPFRRASDYAEREHQGAGLGLAIARQTMLRMGGEISVASTPGVGSTFTIRLPLKR